MRRVVRKPTAKKSVVKRRGTKTKPVEKPAQPKAENLVYRDSVTTVFKGNEPQPPHLDHRPKPTDNHRWEMEYPKTYPTFTVELDFGAFLFMWEWIYATANNIGRSYASPPLVGAIARAAEAFDHAAGQHEEVQAGKQVARAKRVVKRTTKTTQAKTQPSAKRTIKKRRVKK